MSKLFKEFLHSLRQFRGGLSMLLLLAIATTAYIVTLPRQETPIDPLATQSVAPAVSPSPDLPSPPPANLLSASDGKSQITLPDGWSADPNLNSKASIQASNRDREMFLIILTQGKAGLDKYDAQSYSQVTRGYLTKRLEKSSEKGPTEVTSVDGHRTVQYEIQGSLNKIDVVFLHTTVETPTRFVQILAWTKPSSFEKDRPEMEQLIQSFDEK